MKCPHCDGDGWIEFTGVADNMDCYRLPCEHCHGIGRIEVNQMEKYYVGAKHIGSNIATYGHANGYAVETVEEAIEQAKETIRRSHGSVECLVVVKIVAIVRRELPITVINVE